MCSQKKTILIGVDCTYVRGTKPESIWDCNRKNRKDARLDIPNKVSISGFLQLIKILAGIVAINDIVNRGREKLRNKRPGTEHSCSGQTVSPFGSVAAAVVRYRDKGRGVFST